MRLQHRVAGQLCRDVCRCRSNAWAAVITGAGSGIGLETSLLFAKEGCSVVCCDINLATASKTAEFCNAEFGQGSQRAIAVQADVSKEAEVEAAVKLAVSTFGRLDIMCESLCGPSTGRRPTLAGESTT
jgi:NADP-dependent 3-hydroxy acid dehydrogenase YdfG